jgi:hypothetical protein
MGVDIDLNFAKDYQGQWTRMFRAWVLQNKGNEAIGKHLGGLEGNMGKEGFVAAHEGPWPEGKPSILNPRNQPQHFRSVVLKADEINRTFTELSVRNPELLKIGPADYEAGKSEGVALVGTLKPWQIRLPVMKFSGRALYEQKFHLQMRLVFKFYLGGKDKLTIAEFKPAQYTLAGNRSTSTGGNSAFPCVERTLRGFWVTILLEAFSESCKVRAD